MKACNVIIGLDSFLTIYSSCTYCNQNPTLPTLKYILRKDMVAFFTLVLSGDRMPIFMSAIMPFSEVRNSLINLSLSDHTTLGSIASYQAIFIPLVTRTGLPALPANIAVEFSRSCGKRKEEVPELCAAGTAAIHVSEHVINHICVRTYII